MQIHPTSFGDAVLAQLASLVADAKRDDALSPVTVLVRDNIAAITIRRALARGVAGRRGVAAVDVTTLRRRAEHLVSLTGETLPPVTSARTAAVLRTQLGDDPGCFAPVAEHPATVQALARAHEELRGVDGPALDVIARSGELGDDLVRLHRGATARLLDGFRDEAAVLAAAERGIRNGVPGVAALGHIIAVVSEELPPIELRFLRALGAAVPVQVMPTLGGLAELDAPLLAQFSAEVDTADGAERVATRVMHASDADDEVRCVVREVIRLLAAEVPGHRIAVLHSSRVPYARLLHDHLQAAGVATNGPGVRSLRDRAVADAFLSLLALDPDDVQRPALFDWLGRAPMRLADGGSAPRTAWERISREAGISGGDWGARLEEHAWRLQGRLDALAADPDASPGRIAALERHVADTRSLAAFVAELVAALAEGATQATWQNLADWATRLFDRYLGPGRARLPEAEQRAATAIETVLRGLTELDGLGQRPSVVLLREILETELTRRHPRIGRYGEGIFVGPISAAASLDVDHLFVLGLAEDLYPGRPVADPLIPDAVRAATGGALPTASDRLRGKHRALLAAFAAPHVTASFPRGDLRRGSVRLPSRWLMPTLRRLTGTPGLEATRWFEGASPQVISSDSHWSGVRQTSMPGTEQEWRLRHQAGGGQIADEATEAATGIITARSSDDFTRYDGNLTGVDGLPDYADGARAISPTALESYANCPHTFFVERILGVTAVELPEDIVTIRAVDIGNIVHEVMDRLTRESSDALPGHGAPWTPGQRQWMREIAEQVMDEYERQGLTGHPRLWARERELLHRDLEALLDADDALRAERDARVVASELRFGMDGADPVLVEVDDGAVAMRGSADRIDETRDGTLIVTDFKTGSARSFGDIGDDPVAAGKKLQLPLYAHAARAAYGADSVEAAYWFVGRKDRGTRIPVRLDDALESRYRFALGTLVRGIRDGHFIARPPDSDDFAWVQCAYCNPDAVGYGHVRDASARKRRDARLAGLFALLDPTVHEPQEDAR
ncbi:PD-(D/E)XK nuclease family protein [Microbacterium paludicola]|uniref:PD-(D/E)XK nuclease family protein n=1 Tax=Microbacterium paludicola TaxID=300019 RepID=UPI003879DEA5